MSQLEAILNQQLKATGYEFEREYRFAAHHVGLGAGIKDRLRAAGLRDWRADFRIGWLLVEVEGGGWTMGRHNRGAGMAADLLKYDAAMRLGYTVYRCDGAMVKNGRAVETIKLLLKALA